jgi:hypothetical protein
MKPPRGLPDGLDADMTQRITRTFLVVRIVRASLLLVFFGIALVAVQVNGWPDVLAVSIAVAMLLEIGAIVTNIRRYARSANVGDA